jgi:hypothetical protein
LPSATVSQPPTYCVSACFAVVPNQESCFQCIAQTLENKDNHLETACPSLYNGTTITTVDTSLMNESITCHACIASNSTNLTIPTSTVVNGITILGSKYNPIYFEFIWGCITGSFPNTLSTGAIVGIILGSIVFLIALILGIYYGVQYARRKRLSKA